MISLKEIKDAVLHLVFPHVCAGCGSDILHEESVLCMRCIDAMPETNFELHPNNPVEKTFWGRLPLAAATFILYTEPAPPISLSEERRSFWLFSLMILKLR